MYKINFKKICILFLLFNSILFANEIKVSEFRNSSFNLNESIEVFNDSTPFKSINTIKKIFLKKEVAKNKNSHGVHIDAKHKLWLSFTLHNDTNIDSKTILLLQRITTYDIELYWFDENLNKFIKKQSGPSFGNKNMFYKNHMYTFELNAKEKRTYYISTYNTHRGNYMNLVLKDLDEFQKYRDAFFVKMGVLFGALFLMLAYNIIIYFFTKHRFYLLYIVYLVSSILYVFTFFNVGSTLFWSGNKFLNNYDFLYAVHFLIISMLIFSKEFLETRKYFPNINKVIIFILIYAILSIILLPFLPILQKISILFASVLILLLFFLGFFSLRAGAKNAKAYLISWSFLIFGLESIVLDSFGFISINTATNIYISAVFFELFLFSIAIAQIVSKWKTQKEEAKKELDREREKREEILKIEVESKTMDLQKSLTERDILLKEIHHRVKNNMQIIISFIRLQEDKMEKSISHLLKPLEERVRSMVIVHEMFYQNDVIDEVDVYQYTNELLEEISNSTDKDIEITNNTQAISLNLDKMIPLGLIISESVTNSLKHAVFSSGIKIEVSSYIQNNKYVLCIKDNGEKKPKNYSNKNSIGINLMNMMARGKLKGKVDIIYNKGTIVKVEFDI